jgi:hypothetical protein
MRFATSPGPTNATRVIATRCEVRDWVRRIREKPASEQVEYWRKWRDEIARHRGKEAARKLNQDVLEMLRER